VVVEDPAELLTIDDGEVSEDVLAVARQIAPLINDGACLQLGLGKMQKAILQLLRDRQQLTVHSGMISDPVLDLLDAGAISERADAIRCGVALGSQQLYQRCQQESRIHFKPVGYSHQHATLQGIDNLHCINSAIEIDLLGQASGETLAGRQVSGCGGLVDFARGARRSPGGRFILATPATARGGSLSRISPMLDEKTPVSVARQDIDTVVTEYGVAELRFKSVAERAEALIAIAAPQFRQQLSESWHQQISKRL
jgi:acyl-CoA hydrolase